MTAIYTEEQWGTMKVLRTRLDHYHLCEALPTITSESEQLSNSAPSRTMRAKRGEARMDFTKPGRSHVAWSLLESMAQLRLSGHRSIG